MSLYILEDIDWLKGTVSRYEYFFKSSNIKQVLSVHGFTIFSFLVDEIIKLKVLDCFFEIAY